MKEDAVRGNIPNSTEWRSIPSMLIRNSNQIMNMLTDEDLRIRIQFFCVYILFFVVSGVMTVVNIITDFDLLMLSTLIFALVNLVNALLCLLGPRSEQFTRYLFAVEILALFSFFAVFAEPEGFSVIWSALLAVAGLLLYRMKNGIFLCSVQLVILVFLFWTPVGNNLLQYPYTASFKLRFPLLFVAFLSVGIFFEFVRANTQKALVAARARFEYLSDHDPLTGLYNRLGFNRNMDKLLKESQKKGFAFAILDLDSFKRINDRYGHQSGDEVLRRVAENILNAVGEEGHVSRWGGEEFAVLFKNKNKAEDLCQKILEAQRGTFFNFDTPLVCVTVSIGLLKVTPESAVKSSEIVTKADENLYFSKTHGKDRMTVTEI